MPAPDEMLKLVNEEDMELTDERPEVGSGGWSVYADGTCSERIDTMYPSKCDLTWPSRRVHEDAELLSASHASLDSFVPETGGCIKSPHD